MKVTLIVTSSAINKKLEIDKKLEFELEIYKYLENKLEIYTLSSSIQVMLY